MSLLQEFQKVYATFRPKRLDDLRSGAEGMVGRSGVWRTSWIIESGQYRGQWAVQPLGELGHACVESGEGFAWVPECDLEIHYTVPEACEVNQVLSNICSEGTRSCGVQHGDAT